MSSPENGYSSPPASAYSRSFLRMRLPYDRSELFGCFPQRFRKVVQHVPDHLAIIDENGQFSYAELDQASDGLAAAILEFTQGREEPVALLATHGAGAVIAILGVLKAGAIYVALDPTSPKTLESILADSRARLLVAERTLEAQALSLVGDTLSVIWLDRQELPKAVVTLRDDYSPETPAAVLYTTGSTGKPKGVLRTHGRLVYHGWQAAHYLNMGPLDRTSYLHSYAFVASASDIFYPLLTGATIVSRSPAGLNLLEFDAWLRNYEISVLHIPVMLFRQYVESLQGRAAPETIRLVFLSGQTVRIEDVNSIRRLFAPHCLLRVYLGAGEYGHATEFLIDRQTVITTETVPVGYAPDGYEIVVLDENRLPVPAGTPGEIAIRSRFLALEYWGQPELTAERFIPDPFRSSGRLCLTGDLGRMHADGLVEHLGRKDWMLKVRGFRVEPARVEQALRTLESVKDAIVIGQKLPSGDHRLVAYVVPRWIPGPSGPTLRQGLAKELPDYMLPGIFVLLNEFPLASTGKVDRQALPLPDAHRPELDIPYLAPRTPYEEKLCAIWAEVLGWETIGIQDGFLDLGGHSLLAAQIISRINRDFGADLPLHTIFESSTVEQMAQVILERQMSNLEKEDFENLLADLEGDAGE
jgi:amino acid adenylation domain-containing protein